MRGKGVFPSDAVSLDESLPDQRQKIISGGFVRDSMARRMRLKRVNLVGVPDRMPEQGQLPVVELG